MNMIEPYKIHWDDFTKYYKHCDGLATTGACYAFVFNETKPTHFQEPSEFEQCVYIGESGGNYYDKQNGHKGKLRSHVHKRMTSHHKPFTTGEFSESSHKAIIETYGYGDHMLDGTFTNLPMWLCLMIPRPDLPEKMVKQWSKLQERMQLFRYELRFGHCTLGNMDTGSKKDEESYSSYRMQSIKETNLMEFLS